jgi:lysophospholipase L1-like esterase
MAKHASASGSGSGRASAIALLGLVLAGGVSAPAQAGQWLTSWYAAPQPSWGGDFALPTGVPAVLDRQTVRETVRLSAGGSRLRLVFSNRYGHAPVSLGNVRVQVAGEGRAGLPLTFSGMRTVAIPPGAAVTSDALDLPVRPLSRLVVTSYLPVPTPVTSFHWGAQQTVQLAAGDATALPQFTATGRIGARLFLSAVLVEGASGGRTVVTLGDSITDGNGSTPDADRRWPDVLAQRLAVRGIAVANAGISGARLLRDGMGQAALARIEQDVFSQPGVSDVIVLLGINDIGWPGSPFAPAEPAPTFDALTAGFRQLAAAARVRGIRVTVGTLPPFEGALHGTPYEGHYSLAKEALRVRLNAWLRDAAPDVVDAVVDFDAVLRDPQRPQRLRPGFDSGDHLHPGDAGYRAMAQAVVIE